MSEAWTSSRASGDRIEHEIVQRLPVQAISDDAAEWYDCAPTKPLPAHDDRLGQSIVIEPDTPVEIKAARRRNASGQRGRFYLRKRQHARLEAHSGYYLFAVYVPEEEPILSLLLAPASAVDGMIPSWITPDGDAADRATYGQLSWSRFFDPKDLTGGVSL
jgi:hypothetical protein